MNNHEPNDQEISTRRRNTTTKRKYDNVNINTSNNDEEGNDRNFLALSLTSWGRSNSNPPKRTPPHNNNDITQTQMPSSLFSSHKLVPPSPQPPQTLTISHPVLFSSPAPSPLSLLSPNPHNNVVACTASSTTTNVAGPPRPRARRNPTQTPRDHGKSEDIPCPFPWATNRRATVHNLDYLFSRNIDVIAGLVQCKRCERQYEMGFDLREKFLQVGTFIAEKKSSFHDRAPHEWMTPVLPTCKYCDQENSIKPVISDKKKRINWLFLLLGQMLGCCTLEQLKYFCKHTKNHRTGAKDRVLYLTYLGLCKQLDPNGPFDR